MSMKAEILATGDEIRSGALVDSNSAHISQKDTAVSETIRIFLQPSSKK